MNLALSLALALTAQAPPAPPQADPSGPWRAVVDLAGGPLRFAIRVEPRDGGYAGAICNGPSCDRFSAIVPAGDSLVFAMADYDATITATVRHDSLIGFYRNVGNRGPRVIPFRAARGEWPVAPAGDRLSGSWDATFVSGGRQSPRVILVRNGSTGIEAAFLANSGDYGVYWGSADRDSLDLGHFDGAFVYRITARLDGDTLRGTYHAGLRSQTPFTAVRSTGRPHLTPPTEVTRADTVNPFRFSFPDLDGRMVSESDDRFRNKVVLVEIFGTWCPTCHESVPTLVNLHRRYQDRGFEIVGLAYEVTGDSAIDNRQLRRYRDKFGIPYPLLLAGINVTEATAATLPQLDGFSAYPTAVFLGRDGRIRLVHAGFLGPATGAQHQATVTWFRETVERLLSEPPSALSP